MKHNNGFYGEFGGAFVPPHMKAELERVEKAYNELKADPEYVRELERRDQYIFVNGSP